MLDSVSVSLRVQWSRNGSPALHINPKRAVEDSAQIWVLTTNLILDLISACCMRTRAAELAGRTQEAREFPLDDGAPDGILVVIYQLD